MHIRPFFLSLSLLLTTTASAAHIDLVFPSSSFTPGTPISFSVVMPAASNLGAYQIDILLVGSDGQAGADYFFDLAATDAAESGYVFATKDFYLESPNLDSSTIQRLTLSDFDFDGADVVPGVNDAVASVVIGTSPSFLGTLNVFIDADSLFLDTPDISPTPVDEYDAIQAATLATPPTILTTVPEPSSAVALMVGTVAILSRRLKKKRHAIDSELRS